VNKGGVSKAISKTIANSETGIGFVAFRSVSSNMRETSPLNAMCRGGKRDFTSSRWNFHCDLFCSMPRGYWLSDNSSQ